MKKSEAAQLIAETRKWVFQETNGNVSYDIILEAFKELDEIDGEAFVVPVAFDIFTRNLDWPRGSTDRDVAARIRAVQLKLDNHLCPWRNSVYLTHEDGYCFFILGTEQVDVIRAWKQEGRPQGITLTFDDLAEEVEGIPVFGQGAMWKLSASSPLKGWIYLFCIDADRAITPIYPTEGEASEVKISQNSKRNLSDEVNERIGKENKYTVPKPLLFTGRTKGKERLIAVVAERQVPMTIAHLKRRIPLPLLYSHEQISRGIGEGRTNSVNDFSRLSLDQIAIGKLDYIYEG